MSPFRGRSLAHLYARRRYRDPSRLCLNRLRRIDNQIQDHLANLRGVGPDGRKTLRQIQFDRRALGDRHLHQLKHFFDQRRQIDRLERAHVSVARIGHHQFHNLRGANRYRRHSGNILKSRRFGRNLLKGQVGMRKNRAQQVVEVVRDPGRQHTQTLQFLVRHGPLLAALQFRDVQQDNDVAGKLALQETGGRRSGYPPVFPVGSKEAVLCLTGTLFLDGGGDLLSHAVRVPGMYKAKPVLGPELIQRNPQECQKPSAHVGGDPLLVE